MVDVLQLAVEQCEASLTVPLERTATQENSGFALIASILDRFRDGLFTSGSFSDVRILVNYRILLINECFPQHLDNLFAQNCYQFLSSCSPLLLSYLLHRKDENKTLAVWHSLLSAVASSAVSDTFPDQKSIIILLDAAQKGQLPKYLKPQAGELDALVAHLLEAGMNEPVKSEKLALVKQILISGSSGHFSPLLPLTSVFSRSFHFCFGIGYPLAGHYCRLHFQCHHSYSRRGYPSPYHRRVH